MRRACIPDACWVWLQPACQDGVLWLVCPPLRHQSPPTAFQQVWDAQTRRCLFSMASHTMAVSAVRWGGDGHIFSASRDCSINCWDAQARSLSPSRGSSSVWPCVLLFFFRRRIHATCRCSAMPVHPAGLAESSSVVSAVAGVCSGDLEVWVVLEEHDGIEALPCNVHRGTWGAEPDGITTMEAGMRRHCMHASIACRMGTWCGA